MDKVEQRDMLVKCASTALNSKLIERQKGFFSEMIVQAVLSLDEDAPTGMLGIKRITGGSTTDSFLVDGVAFKKTFSYAGFEQQPKRFKNPKIVALNVELELKSEKQNAEIRIEDPTQYQSIVDAEWSIIYAKLNSIVDSGAKVVLSKLPIGDLATQFFADRDIFCAGRVEAGDLTRVCSSTGAVIQTSLNDLNDSVLGVCADFEERQIGGDRYNVFTGYVFLLSSLYSLFIFVLFWLFSFSNPEGLDCRVLQTRILPAKSKHSVRSVSAANCPKEKELPSAVAGGGLRPPPSLCLLFFLYSMTRASGYATIIPQTNHRTDIFFL